MHRNSRFTIIIYRLSMEEVLNSVMWEEQKTVVLLETMAGKGSEIGSSFRELREIINRVNFKEKIGVRR